MEGQSSAQSAAASSSTQGGEKSINVTEPPAILECNICMDVPKDPVATSCGHLFCWPCLDQWLQQYVRKTCPVCRTGLSRNLNILSLHPAAANAGNTAAAHSSGEGADVIDLVPSPRPANPVFFFPQEPGSSSDPESDASQSLAITAAFRMLLGERARGLNMLIDRAIMREQRDEKQVRNLQLTQKIQRMRERNALLQRRLDLANRLLPSE